MKEGEQVMKEEEVIKEGEQVMNEEEEEPNSNDELYYPISDVLFLTQIPTNPKNANACSLLQTTHLSNTTKHGSKMSQNKILLDILNDDDDDEAICKRNLYTPMVINSQWQAPHTCNSVTLLMVLPVACHINVSN